MGNTTTVVAPVCETSREHLCSHSSKAGSTPFMYTVPLEIQNAVAVSAQQQPPAPAVARRLLVASEVKLSRAVGVELSTPRAHFASDLYFFMHAACCMLAMWNEEF